MIKPFQIHISPTGIQAALKCPAKLWWAQQWELRKRTSNFGLQVHQHMEDGTEFDPKKDFKEVGPILSKLRVLQRTLGYKVLGREVKHSYSIRQTDDYEVVYTTIFDAPVRLPTGDFAIVDYKSCIHTWPTSLIAGTLYVPKAATLQGAGYLLPSPEKLKVGKRTFGDSKGWFESVLFLMAPEQGDAAWYPYYHNQEDQDAFVTLCETAVDWMNYIRRTGNMLRNRGDECDNRRAYGKRVYGWQCEWFEICYNLPGWERLYRRKSYERTK